MKTYLLALLICLSWPLFSVALQVSHVDMPPAEETRCLYFDGYGLLWIGTSAGLKAFDGYEVHDMFPRATSQLPQLGSDIRCMMADGDSHLWVGTNDGLVRISLTTGTARLYRFPRKSQQIIYELHLTRHGTLYVGTDDGFSVYNKEKDTFRHFNRDNTRAIYPDGHKGRYEGWGVKDFAETASGDLIIGTWSQGLWRYSPRTGKIHAYAKVNAQNYAFRLCLDHQGRLWIGSEGNGIQRLDRLDDYRLHTLHQADHDPLLVNGQGQQVIHNLTLLSDGRIYVAAGDTVDVQQGHDGAIWKATHYQGIYRMKEGPNLFTTYGQGPVRCIFTENGRQFFLGYDQNALSWLDITTGTQLFNNLVPGFSWLPKEGFAPQVAAIVRRFNGELWASGGDNGILVSRPDGTGEICYGNTSSIPYVRDNTTAIFEASDHTLWIGQRQGVSVLSPDGHGRHLDIKTDSLDMTGYFMVNHISEDHTGTIWIASANNGIVSIHGQRHRHYTTPTTNVTACFEDSQHRLWAISNSGLLRYNKARDRFERTDRDIHLTGTKVLAINEDRYGALWLTTNQALVRIDSDGSAISFSTQDGLPNTSFFPNSTFRYGNQLFFGTIDGLVAFTPRPSYQHDGGTKPSLLITDMLIDGTSLDDLDSAHAASFCKEEPMSARHLTISPDVKKFSIRFALLTYANQEGVQYAYRLDGLDNDWQFVDGNTHEATFERIPAGTYHFRLRATDSYGQTYTLPYSITIRVRAPWYATWWACLLYLCLLAIVLWFVRRYVLMRRELKASQRFSTILQSTQNQEEEQPAAGNGNAEFIARATQLVRDHLDDSTYNRDRMAADLNMSVSTLYSRLRDCTDLSIQTFIQTIRLNAACDMLRADPNIRISELAYSVGFNTPKYFSQCFKRAFGMLPGDFARSAATQTKKE